MQQLVKFGMITIAWLVLCGFTMQKSPAPASSQPAEERKAQDALPQSHDPVWKTLFKTKIHVDEKRGLYSATFPPEVKALDGTQVTISGFMLPVESTMKFKHFILAKRTPTCPFCPPGEPNEIVDVWLDKNIEYSERMLTVTGTFSFMNNQQFGMFFKLNHAAVDAK